MTLLTVPVYSRNHAPHLPTLSEKKFNWMGRIIQKIHISKEKGIIQKIFLHALAILSSLVLIFSFIGIPFFIYAFREYTHQECRIAYDQKYRQLLEIATEHAKHQFIRGRIGPFDSIDFHLNSATRKKMIHDLEFKDPEKDTIHLLDIDLLRMVAVKYNDFLLRYKISVRN